jgi:sec-independent protein translocase protein TatA
VKPGLFQILIIALIIVVLFGRGRISEMMGDFGKGIKSFKRGIAEDEPIAPRLETAEAVAEPAADTTAR